MVHIDIDLAIAEVHSQIINGTIAKSSLEIIDVTIAREWQALDIAINLIMWNNDGHGPPRAFHRIEEHVMYFTLKFEGSIAGMAASMRDVTENIASIAESVNQVAQTTTQIAENMTGITDKNAQIADAAQKNKTAADELMKAASRFKTDK